MSSTLGDIAEAVAGAGQSRRCGVPADASARGAPGPAPL